MAGRFSVEAVFRAIDKMSAPVSGMQRRVSGFARSLHRGVSNVNTVTDKLGESLKRVGMIGAVTMAGLGVAVADVVNTGANFEQSLVNAAAKFPEGIRPGTDAFKELENVARRTGATTEFTASQSAEALNFLAMAGFNAQQSISSLPGVVDLATAAQVDLATASDIATDTLGAFNLATKDTIQLEKNLTRVNDVMARTTNTANTTMELMFETIKQAGPVAATAGADIETFSTLTGILASNGIKASQAGTTLKNMFTRLAGPPSEAAKALQFLGVQTKDAGGNMRDIIDIIGDVNAAIVQKGLGSAQRLEILTNLFSARAIAGAGIFFDKGADSMRAYREELRGATGASASMASIMRDTVLGRLRTFQSALESTKISLFTLRKSGITALIERGTEWVRNLDTLINTNEDLANKTINQLIDKVITATKVFAGLVVVFVTLKTVVLIGQSAILLYQGTMLLVIGVTKTWALINTLAIAGLKQLRAIILAVNLALAVNPISLVVVAIGALIAGIVLLIRNWDNLKTKFLSFSKPVQAALTIAFLPLVLLVRLIRESIAWFQRMRPIIADVMANVVERISAGVTTVKSVFSGLFSFLGGFGQVLEGIFDRIGSAISKVIGAITSGSAISNIIDRLAEFGSVSLFGEMNQPVTKNADQVLNGLKNQGGVATLSTSNSPSVIPPQERMARTVEEYRQTNTAEIVIRDDSGRAEIQKSNLNKNTTLKLANSGGL